MHALKSKNAQKIVQICTSSRMTKIAQNNHIQLQTLKCTNYPVKHAFMNLKQNMQLEASSKYTNNLIAHYQPQDCTNIICNSRLQICKQSKLRIPKLRMHKSIYAISRLNVQITQFHISKPKNLHDYPFLNPKLYKKKSANIGFRNCK